jgi:Cof subfamily protein (haloacid dehalogenase superfamily)
MKLPKLIVSDLDGTLVKEAVSVLPQDTVEILDRLQALGIPFAVSSGRQAASLQQVFDSLAQPPLIIALNGGVICRGEELLYEDPMPRQIALQLAREAAQRPQVNVILETFKMCWAYHVTKEFTSDLDVRKYRYQVIEDLEQVQGQVVKVACSTKNDIDGLQHWAEGRCEGGIKAARSGDYWVDFNVADKGKGLRSACRALGIETDDVIAFGDNLNDALMLSTAGKGYAVAGSLLAATGKVETCASVQAVLEKICEEAEKKLAF